MASIIVVFLCFSGVSAFAQESDDISNAVSDFVEGVEELVSNADSSSISNNGGSTSLYIPDHMVVGETYYGMVTIVNHDEQYQLIEIAANADAVTVPDTVPILPHKDHAKFEIVSKHAGSFTIAVKINEVTLKQTVFSSDASDDANSLSLSIPENTKTENLIGAIYVVDSINSPIVATEDIKINLQGSTGIRVPDTITISKGTTGASFGIHTTASGSISASSNTMYDSVNISFETTKPKVMMDVFPKIMRENSFGYYFLWFENEGLPYIPHIPTSATVHSSNLDVARMDLTITADNTSSIKNTFFDGVTYGRIFTGEQGVARVTGTIPGFGSASSEFIVGPASIGTVTITNNTFVPDVMNGTLSNEELAAIENEPKVDTESINATPIDVPRGQVLHANTLLFDVIPPRSLSESYVVAGLYFSETDETTTIDEDNIETSKVITALHPMAADERDIYISSNGANHKDIVLLENLDIPTHVNLYNITGNVGDYEVSVTAPQVESRDPLEFSIVADDSDIYSIGIIPLPITPEHIQDVALLYIADSNGAVVNPREVFGSGITVHLTSDYVFFSEKSIHLNDPVSKIRGALSDDASNKEITAFANGLADTTVLINTLMVSDDSSVTIHVPDLIRSGEEFVASAHVIKGDKATSQITDLIRSSGGCEEIKIGLFSCDGPGGLSIFSDFGDHDLIVDPYRTPLDVSIDHPFGESLSLGKQYSVMINSIDDITIHVDTAIDYTIDGKTITLNPDTIGIFDMTIVVSSPGKEQYLKSYGVTVDNLIDLSVLAKDEQGYLLGFNVTITGAGEDINQVTDYMDTIPRQSITVSYPDSARHGTSGYEFLNIEVDDGTEKTIFERSTITLNPETDHIILATYKQVFLIDVIDGTGSGIYESGDLVTISAPEKFVMAFLIREVLDEWRGVDSSEPIVQFLAEKDLTITAVYRTDYVGAVAVFAIGGAIVTILAFKQSSSYYLKISQILDLFKGITKSKNKKGKKSKKDKSKDKKSDDVESDEPDTLERVQSSDTTGSGSNDFKLGETDKVKPDETQSGDDIEK